MQLYKSRGFSEFFQDTFGFLKQNGKHFFKHYFIINGIFLLILMTFGYFFTKFYSELIFGGVLQGKSTNVLDEYINENAGWFVVLLLLFLLVALISAIISYAYTPIYLKLYAEKGGKNFETKDLVDSYKNIIGKLIIYLVCCILLGIPLIIVFAICGFILAITIVGILALPLLVGAFMLLYTMALMEYLEDKKGIWESFGYSWNLLTSKFWAAVGSVGIFYLISYIAQNVISLIPYVFGMASLFTTIDQGAPTEEELGATMMIIMLLVFFLTFIVSATLGTIVQLNQGIIFYSLKEDKENINTKDIIDQIGSGA
ncbi:hypothetical protein [Seonamhaeicola maritimus]|uniref:Glycerophosphoryl diester phosphodiesterase membrane domain-containing protein n=1 Tax=Seonamhaeicola maritimus TaxID=2591822 RepID=A0A5C7GLJ4_9FLAO|nr:hypothetical protein [Seonamhaeicola maritimus]TXG39134.1 hypothetical protein FUA22_04455 [Seonamhaeicola maritimus]